MDEDQKTADKINKMTKKELVEIIFKQEASRKGMLSHINKIERDKEVVETKLLKAEAYVEQGRAMIEAVMERWYEYDV